MNFSTCIDMMFPDLPFADRIAMTKEQGIGAVEFWRWSNKDISALADTLDRLEMKAVLLNLDSRDEKLSADLMRGILSHRRTNELISAIHESAPVMRRLGIDKAIVLAGDIDPDISYEKALANIRESLRVGAKAAEDEGITLVLEPLNTYDRNTYVMPYSAPAFDIIREIASPSLKVLLDLYHTQRMEGNLIATLTENIDLIGHFHVANSPLRCEPNLGEINYHQVFQAIKSTSYSNYTGFEYKQKNKNFSLKEYITGDAGIRGFLKKAWQKN